jgi:hypothetical protein
MAPPDLCVDYSLLEEASKSLSSLISEFDNIKAQEGAYDGALGSGNIASAMDSFAGNWDYHRRKLTENMQAVGELIDNTMKSFQQADQKLKDSLTCPAPAAPPR